MVALDRRAALFPRPLPCLLRGGEETFSEDGTRGSEDETRDPLPCLIRGGEERLSSTHDVEGYADACHAPIRCRRP